MTIHPKMLYYNEKQDNDLVRVKHAFIGISEETKHDADLAFAFENQAFRIVKDRGIEVEEVHEWTDGCATHYKGKKAFADKSKKNTISG